MPETVNNNRHRPRDESGRHWPGAHFQPSAGRHAQRLSEALKYRIT